MFKPLNASIKQRVSDDFNYFAHLRHIPQQSNQHEKEHIKKEHKILSICIKMGLNISSYKISECTA